jgi:hypothetical protein
MNTLSKYEKSLPATILIVVGIALLMVNVFNVSAENIPPTPPTSSDTNATEDPSASITSGTTLYFPIIWGPPPPTGLPLFATSYYIQDENRQRLCGPAWLPALGVRDRDLARSAGQPGDPRSFGQMWLENGVYGVGKFSPYWQFIPLSAVNTAVREYVRGYWVCSGNDFESQVTVGIGVNNYGRMNTGTSNQEVLRSTAYEFGKRFGDLVHDVNVWAVQQGYASQVYVAGANDIEWDSTGNWQSSYVTRGWVDGFHERDRGIHIYFNFGACSGCPTNITSSNLNWTYSIGNWSLDDIWFVTWGASPAYPLPEIYLTSGTNARQWYAISKYAAMQKGARIGYIGPMTQYGACQVRSNDYGCSSGQTNNTPEQGWIQLYNELNKDPLTAQNILRWVTDITWQIR